MREVRILYLEDNKNDAELVTELLEAMPLKPKVDHVASGVLYREKISNNRYDLILSDYSIPGFSGMDALHMASSLTPDTPFIFFSGTIGEEVAVDSLHEGATDYVVKQRPGRLPATITRALENADLKRQQRANQDSVSYFQANILEQRDGRRHSDRYRGPRRLLEPGSRTNLPEVGRANDDEDAGRLEPRVRSWWFEGIAPSNPRCGEGSRNTFVSSFRRKDSLGRCQGAPPYRFITEISRLSPDRQRYH